MHTISFTLIAQHHTINKHGIQQRHTDNTAGKDKRTEADTDSCFNPPNTLPNVLF